MSSYFVVQRIQNGWVGGIGDDVATTKVSFVAMEAQDLAEAVARWAMDHPPAQPKRRATEVVAAGSGNGRAPAVTPTAVAAPAQLESFSFDPNAAPRPPVAARPAVAPAAIPGAAS